MKISYCGNLHCENTVGSYVCGCKNGFETIGDNCLDINECKKGETCPVNSLCENFIGSFTCTCKSGYSGELCLDVDECLSNGSYCDANAKCTNTVGSYNCDCNFGYYGNGKVCYRGQCDDKLCPINEECVSPTVGVLLPWNADAKKAF